MQSTNSYPSSWRGAGKCLMVGQVKEDLFCRALIWDGGS